MVTVDRKDKSRACDPTATHEGGHTSTTSTYTPYLTVTPFKHESLPTKEDTHMPVSSHLSSRCVTQVISPCWIILALYTSPCAAAIPNNLGISDYAKSNTSPATTILYIFICFCIFATTVPYFAEFKKTLELPKSKQELPGPVCQPAPKGSASNAKLRPIVLHTATIAWLALSVVGIGMTGLFWYSTSFLNSHDCNSLNPDISGMGVRVSLWVPGAVVMLIAGLGHFHAEETGVKNINMTLLGAQIYYGFNLATKEMAPVDMLIGAMVLDCLISITSITFSMKECLAARQLIRVGHAVQLFALCSLAWVMRRLHYTSFNGSVGALLTDGLQLEVCSCFQAYWWGSVGTCNGTPPTFWLYLTLKAITFIHGAWLCLWHMGNYDAAEKSERDDKNTDIFIPKTVYDSIPATAFTKYQEWTILSIASIINIELTLSGSHFQGATSMGLSSWGQTAQVVVTCVTLFSWWYGVYSMFKEKSVKRRQEFLNRTSTGSIPQLHIQRPRAWGAWLRETPQIVYHDHPFNKLPLRCINHARVEYQTVAWAEISHEYYRHPTTRKLGDKLIHAAQLGDLVEVRDLLAKQASVAEVDELGESALVKARKNGHFGVLTLLLAHDADISSITGGDNTSYIMPTTAGAAGLALAVFQLIDNGLRSYTESARTAKGMRPYGFVLNSLSREVDLAKGTFENICELLLEGMVSDSTPLIENPGGPLWGASDLQEKLRGRLHPATLSSFKDRVEELISILLRLQREFVLYEKPRLNKRTTKKIKVALSNNRYTELLAAITKVNSDLMILIDQTPSIKPQITTPTGNYNHIRNHAINLYEVLKENLQTCRCSAPHNINLQLDIRNATTQRSDNRDKNLRFQVVFFFDDSTPENPLSWNWREIEIEPLDSELGHQGSECINEDFNSSSLEDKEGLLSCEMMRTASRRQSMPKELALSALPNGTAKEIENLCLTIQQAKSGASCLGVLTDKSNRRYLVWESRALSSGSDSELSEMLSLESLLIPEALEKKDRLILGVQLASTVMKFHDTEWLDENWGKGDIFFRQKTIQNGGRGSVIMKPFIRRVFASPSPFAPSQVIQESTKPSLGWRNRSLFSLGIILVELWYGECLEKLRIEADGGGDTADYNTAKRLISEISREAGEKYGAAVKWCIIGLGHDSISPETNYFKKEVHMNVVSPLVENLEWFNDEGEDMTF